jgi:hypothetical protein
MDEPGSSELGANGTKRTSLGDPPVNGTSLSWSGRGSKSGSSNERDSGYGHIKHRNHSAAACEDVA